MSNLLIEILSCLASINGANAYIPQTTATNSDTSTTDSDNLNFVKILSQLNNNIDNAAIKNELNLTGYNNYNFNLNNNIQTAIIPDIDSIVQKIKDDKSGSLDVDSQIRNYLLQYYGGSQSAVITNLSGVQKLPTQLLAMQDQIFNQIVTKISTQVREKIYTGHDSSDLSLFYSDDSNSESTDYSGSLDL